MSIEPVRGQFIPAGRCQQQRRGHRGPHRNGLSCTHLLEARSTLDTFLGVALRSITEDPKLD
jgi:hypothetical protein